jgi:hypothetical protein
MRLEGQGYVPELVALTHNRKQAKGKGLVACERWRLKRVSLKERVALGASPEV